MKTVNGVFLSRNTNNCKVVIAEDFSIVEKTAAEELVCYFEKSLGLKLPIVSEKEAEGKCIYVGQTAYAKTAGAVGSSKENWIIKMHEGNLILTGGKEKRDRGIIYAVYHFLEDIVGVRWWNPYEEDVLTLDELVLADDFYKEGTPYFSYRKAYMDHSAGVEAFPHIVRTRMNVVSAIDDGITQGAYDPDVRKYGEIMHMGRPHHVHTMGKYFLAEQYYEEHPEWWAWNKIQKKRMSNGHYCFSNESFFENLLGRLLAYIKEDVELSEKTGVELPCFYSLSPDDLSESCFCECDECSKIIKESGYSGYVIRFVNRVAREVYKQYPFARIETLSYANFLEPPKDETVPEKNVIIRLADVFEDVSKGFEAKSNATYLRRLKSWSALCAKSGSGLYIWEYLYNIRTNYPLPIFDRVKSTIRGFKDYNVEGIFVETEQGMADFWELNKYMLSHLMEDPDADENALLEDFTDRYYGKAGKYVREYYKVLREGLDRNPVHVLCCLEGSPFNYLDLETVTRGTEILDKAMEVIKDEQPYRARVNWVRKPLDAVILWKYFDFRKQAADQGKSFCFDHGILKQRITAALEEFGKTPAGKFMTQSIEAEITYFNNLSDTEVVFDIPEMLSDVRKEDIYQFPMNRMIKFVQKNLQRIYGYTGVEDEKAACEKVMKLSRDTGTGFGWDYEMVPTSRDAALKQPIRFILHQGTEVREQISLYKEDLSHDAYKIYKIGTISGIKDDPYTRVALFEIGNVSINLSGLAVTFPMDECDVYLSMRFTGELYGGKKEEENAIYFERMIVVRKK